MEWEDGPAMDMPPDPLTPLDPHTPASLAGAPARSLARLGAYPQGDGIDVVVHASQAQAVDLVLLQRPILARASEPFPTALGTLDALHLSTAKGLNVDQPRNLAKSVTVE